MRSFVRAALVVAPALLAAGCTCNQDYAFPEPTEDARTFSSDEIGDIGSWLSFDQSPEGKRLTMAYYSRQFGALGYAVGTMGNDGVQWSHEKVAGWPDNVGLDLDDMGAYASQRTAPDGTVWVAYRDLKNDVLMVSHRLGGPVWDSPVQIDAGAGSDPSAGHWASLDLDASGAPVVVSSDNGSKTVRVARLGGGSWSVTEAYKSVEIVEAVDTGADRVFEAGVSHTRLMIHQGTEYIALYDAAQGALHLLEGTDSAWADTIVDDSGDVGQWPSMWTDGDTLVIAYQDVGEQDLKVATRTGGAGGSWSLEVVDDGAFRGADTEIFERDGDLHVVYFDGHDNDSWLAVQESGGWSLNKIGSDGRAVGFHNEVMAVDGTWWVGSYDFTERGLYLTNL